MAGNTKRLFMYLAANSNRALLRENLIDVIMPERGSARAASALNTAIWRIKRCIAQDSGLKIETIDDVVRLTVAPPAFIDARRLDATVKAALPESCRPALPDGLRRALADAIAGCNGEFLEGVGEHWALPLRERYGALYLQGLSVLMRDAAGRGEFETALSYARDILTRDPFREGTQCEVMWLYMRNGQRVQAIRQFRNFEALLRDELGIEPMRGTRAFYDSILTAAPVPPLGSLLDRLTAEDSAASHL